MDLAVETNLGSFDVLSPDGHPVQLASLWRDQPAVLGFVRHFG